MDNWPSTNVTRGGFLHPPQCQYSEVTHNLIKTLMDEAKLTMSQRRKIKETLKSGEALPYLSEPITTCTSKCVKKLNTVPVRFGPPSRRRPLEAILQSDAYTESGHFKVPILCRDNAKEKQLLQKKMASCKDEEKERKKSKKLNKELYGVNLSSEQTSLNRYDQLVQEIATRQQFLDEMETLNQAHKYRLIIEEQIQAKINEMHRLVQ